MESDTYPDDRVSKLAEQFVPVKVNADEEKDIARKFKVQGLPTIVFVDASGNSVGKIRGYLPPADLAETMEGIARIHRELPKLQAHYDDDPSNIELGAMLATAYASRGDQTKAKRLIQAVERDSGSVAPAGLVDAYLALGDYYFEEKEDYKNASKMYAKVAEIGTNPRQVADARFNTAMASFYDHRRLPAGSRGALKKLDFAEKELDSLLAIEGLPEDRREQAERLNQDIAKAREDNLEEAEKDTPRSRRSRRRQR